MFLESRTLEANVTSVGEESDTKKRRLGVVDMVRVAHDEYNFLIRRTQTSNRKFFFFLYTDIRHNWIVENDTLFTCLSKRNVTKRGESNRRDGCLCMSSKETLSFASFPKVMITPPPPSLYTVGQIHPLENLRLPNCYVTRVELEFCFTRVYVHECQLPNTMKADLLCHTANEILHDCQMVYESVSSSSSTLFI